MGKRSTWTILLYLCGDASGKLLPDTLGQEIDVAVLLNETAGTFSGIDANLVAEGHLALNRRAVRLVQTAGQEVGQVAMIVEAVDDSPAARDAFISWATEKFPANRTLLLLADCQAGPNQRYTPPGTTYELVASPDGPDMRPLTEDTLDELLQLQATEDQ